MISGRQVEWVPEADLKNFFGSLSHEWMLRFVEHRVGDPRLISLIRRRRKAGVLEDQEVHPNEEGTPQGGSISVLLSNLYILDTKCIHGHVSLWIRPWSLGQIAASGLAGLARAPPLSDLLYDAIVVEDDLSVTLASTVSSAHQLESDFQLRLVLQASAVAERIIASVPDLAEDTGFRKIWLQINHCTLKTLWAAFASPSWIRWIIIAIRLLKNNLYVNLPDGYPRRHLSEFSTFCVSYLPVVGRSWLPVIVPENRSFLVPNRAVLLVLQSVAPPLKQIEWRSSANEFLFRTLAGVPVPYSEQHCPRISIFLNSSCEHLFVVDSCKTETEASRLNSRLDELPLSAKSLLVRHFDRVRFHKRAETYWTPGELSIGSTAVTDDELCRMILREQAYQTLVAHSIDPALPDLLKPISRYVDSRGASLGWWLKASADDKRGCQESIPLVKSAQSALSEEPLSTSHLPARAAREPRTADELPAAARALIGSKFTLGTTSQKSGKPPDWSLLDRLSELPTSDLHRLSQMLQCHPRSESLDYVRAAVDYALGKYLQCVDYLRPYLRMDGSSQEYTILAAFCARQMGDSSMFERLLFEQ